MKIFMYSDLHISKTSSILPLTEDKYSYRQKMIMKTGKWLESIIDKEKPDIIINLGDTFDQHTITSYDIDTAYEFFKCFRMFNIPHIVLVGNHEMINKEFNAVKILNNITNITVITKPCTSNASVILSNNGDSKVKLAFLPYCNYKDLNELPEGDFLFSHIDIMGSNLRGNILLEEGLKKEQLTQYKLVFNGHIHKPSISGNIINVGSVTSHSFSDDEDSVPLCSIFDTDTMDYKQFKSSNCPLFRRIEVIDINDLNLKLDKLDSNYKYCLNCTCPFEIKDQVKGILDNNKNIVSSRLNVKVSEIKENVSISNFDLQTNININETFKEFLDYYQNGLKYPKSYYQDILLQL